MNAALPAFEFATATRIVPDLGAKSRVASSMRAHPIARTDAELTEIAERSL